MIQNRKIKTIIAKLLGVDKTMQIAQCVPLVVDISFHQDARRQVIKWRGIMGDVVYGKSMLDCLN